MLKETYNQDEDQILAHCRGLYLRVKDAYPRHTMPHKVSTKVLQLQRLGMKYALHNLQIH